MRMHPNTQPFLIHCAAPASITQVRSRKGGGDREKVREIAKGQEVAETDECFLDWHVEEEKGGEVRHALGVHTVCVCMRLASALYTARPLTQQGRPCGQTNSRCTVEDAQ